MTVLHQRKIQGFGWKPDLPDHRDFMLTLQGTDVANLPANVDLRDSGHLPAPYDQGELGSCTANAIAAAIEYQLRVQAIGFQDTPSRLFIYFNERYMEGTVNEDSGAQIRDGIKACSIVGVPPESMWPYDISQFAVEPPMAIYQAALADVTLGYQRVAQSAVFLKACLAAGRPIVFGFSVYESFETSVGADGVMPWPGPSESEVGGHAVLCVGYTTISDQPYWIVRNSWGSEWADAGYFYMPEAYLTTRALAGDLWSITLEGPSPQVQEEVSSEQPATGETHGSSTMSADVSTTPPTTPPPGLSVASDVWASAGTTPAEVLFDEVKEAFDGLVKVPKDEWESIRSFVESRRQLVEATAAVRPRQFTLGPGDLPVPPAPLPSEWTSTTFWTTTILPIVLAVVAYTFHKDLSSSAPGLAAIGAGICTLGYTIYSALKHQAHAVATAAYYAARSSFPYHLVEPN